MSITLNFITKKLSFLSSVQRTICSRSQVTLVQRGFLTTQTLPSHIEKVLQDTVPPQYNCATKLLLNNTNNLEQSLCLQAKPCLGTPDDISVTENHLLFNIVSRDDRCTQLNNSFRSQSTDQSSKPNLSGRASEEQLIAIRESLAKTLPLIFVEPLDYRTYHQDVVFINNIRGTQSKGIMSYAKQVNIMRILGHVKFAYVKFEILKITSHPEDNTVRVRWRIRGIKGYMAIWNVLRHRKWRAKDQMEKQDLWYDGFSTFYVGPDGRIHKHVADKMMPDDNPVEIKAGSTLAPKLAALCVGFALSDKDSLFSMSPTKTEESPNL